LRRKIECPDRGSNRFVRSPKGNLFDGSYWRALSSRPAIEALESSAKHQPGDPNTAKLIDALRNGKVEINQAAPPAR
jgi:hypothetical protein